MPFCLLQILLQEYNSGGLVLSSLIENWKYVSNQNNKASNLATASSPSRYSYHSMLYWCLDVRGKQRDYRLHPSRTLLNGHMIRRSSIYLQVEKVELLLNL